MQCILVPSCAPAHAAGRELIVQDAPYQIPTVAGAIKKTPTPLRTTVGDWIVIVTCPYCHHEHTHAASRGPGVDPGFKLASCRTDRRGYNVVAGEVSGEAHDA